MLARPSSQLRMRACWVTQAAVGCSVQLARKTRREANSMKNSTSSCFNQTVPTVTKSQETVGGCKRRRVDLGVRRNGVGD